MPLADIIHFHCPYIWSSLHIANVPDILLLPRIHYSNLPPMKVSAISLLPYAKGYVWSTNTPTCGCDRVPVRVRQRVVQLPIFITASACTDSSWHNCCRLGSPGSYSDMGTRVQEVSWAALLGSTTLVKGQEAGFGRRRSEAATMCSQLAIIVGRPGAEVTLQKSPNCAERAEYLKSSPTSLSKFLGLESR